MIRAAPWRAASVRDTSWQVSRGRWAGRGGSSQMALLRLSHPNALHLGAGQKLFKACPEVSAAQVSITEWMIPIVSQLASLRRVLLPHSVLSAWQPGQPWWHLSGVMHPSAEKTVQCVPSTQNTAQNPDRGFDLVPITSLTYSSATFLLHHSAATLLAP